MTSEREYKYVKGSTRSNRLGDVLSVDFSPKKICSFDCIYCGVGRTTDKTLKRGDFYPVEGVFGEIQDWVGENHLPDYTLLTGSGEPTLYSQLGRLVRLVRSGIPGLKSMVYCNGSLMYSEEVREEMLPLDLVVINLNSADEDIFRQICRPHSNIVLDRLIDGIKSFRSQYDGPLWIDVVLIKGVNTQRDVLQRLMNTIGDINPDRCLVRPPRPTEGENNKQRQIEIPEELKDRWRDLPFDIDYDE